MFDAESLKKTVLENDIDGIKKILFDLGSNEQFWGIGYNYQQIKEILPAQHQHLISNYFFPIFLKNIANTIFIEETSTATNESPSHDQDLNVTQRPCQVIYNNTEYLSPENEFHSPNNRFTSLLSKTFLDNFTALEGKPLKLGNTPIGYNVHIPPSGSVKGVFLRVYGGMFYMAPPFLLGMTPEEHEQQFRDGAGHHPGSLEEIEKKLLLNQDIAVVTLNLPDLLELKVNQGQMPKELHDKIHACINRAYEVIHGDPETLSPELSILRDKPVVLSGMSFGGRTAAMHAALYPDTFDGYVSINGAISNEMHMKSDLPDLKGSPLRQYLPHLDPGREEYLKSIQDSILVIHTRDDSNLNVKIAIDFYNKLKSMNKSDLVNLMIFDKGGHAYIQDPSLLKVLEQDLARFVQDGASDLAALHEWRAFRQDSLANQFYGEATLNEKFLSSARQTTENRDLRKHLEHFDKLWVSTYEPLFTSIFFANQITNSPEALDNEINRLNNILTEKEATNAFKANQKMFLTFVNQLPEKLYIKNGPWISEDTIQSMSSKEILDLYKTYLNTLKSAQPGQVDYFLLNLYQANPHLISSVRKAHPEMEEQLKSKAKSAKKSLRNSIQTEKKMILNTWKQAIVKAADKHKKAISDDEKPSGKKLKK